MQFGSYQKEEWLISTNPPPKPINQIKVLQIDLVSVAPNQTQNPQRYN